MEQTIPAALAGAAREFGDAPALAEPGGPRLSYRQLHDRANTIARVLDADGVAPGDRVAIWSPNTYHWVLAALGALCAGATLVPVNTRFTGPEALDVISRSGASVLFVAGPFLGTDRLAALRAAAAEADIGPAGSLGRLRRIVQVPVAERPAGCGRGHRLGPIRRTGRRRSPGGPRPNWPPNAPRWWGPRTSATSCSPRAPPGGARG